MRIGVPLGPLHPAARQDVAIAAERLGFESVWMSDHLVLPRSTDRSSYPFEGHPPLPAETPFPDPFITLAFVGAHTSRLRLGTAVYNIGLRHPFVTARSVATLDSLTAGRVEFGVGASWLREAWEAVGLDFDTRGERIDESIELCRELWTDDIIEHVGPNFEFQPVSFEPKPVQIGGPPVHIGGDSAVALRRVARLGDGWLPLATPLDQIGGGIAAIRNQQTPERFATPLEVSVIVRQPTLEQSAQLASAGVTRLIAHTWTRSSEAIASLEAFAATVESEGWLLEQLEQ